MSMAINTTNSALLYKAIGNVQPPNSNVQTTRLSSGNRINVASDDASSLSPSVRATFSPEAMALQHTTTQGADSLLDAVNPSAKAVIDLGTPPTEIKDLQILKTPMLNQADASQAVIQLLK